MLKLTNRENSFLRRTMEGRSKEGEEGVGKRLVKRGIMTAEGKITEEGYKT